MIMQVILKVLPINSVPVRTGSHIPRPSMASGLLRLQSCSPLLPPPPSWGASCYTVTPPGGFPKLSSSKSLILIPFPPLSLPWLPCL